MTQVRLRPLREDDVPVLRSVAEDPQTKVWNAIREPDLVAWIDQQNEVADDFCTWAVADPAVDRLLGVVSALHIDAGQGTAELGYRVAPAERGRGVATAALSAAATHLFDEAGLRRLELFHAVENLASCIVAERAGFRLEGTLRQSYLYGDGVPHDEHLHARLVTD